MKPPALMACALACVLSAAPLQASDTDPSPSVTAGGLMFGDFYYVGSNHLPGSEGARGVVLRRGYLTLNFKFSQSAFGRARLEANQSGEFETYDFDVRFKDLYAGWNLGRHKVLLGLAPTPTFDLIESIWGARYLARTPLDLQGVPSRDTGISARGPLNRAGSINYRVMAGAGIDFGADSNDEEQRWMGAVSWSPAPGWVLDFYSDYNETSGRADRLTLQGFISYQSESYRWGAQYAHQDRQDEPPLELASAFLVADLPSGFSLIGRVDRLFEPSPRGNDISYIPFDPSAPATLFIGGAEFQISPHVTMTPNVLYTRYDVNDAGVRPQDDLQLRLTLFLDFE